jgi:Fic family protein
MLSYSLFDNQIKELKFLHVKAQSYFDKIQLFSEEELTYLKKQSLISNIGASTRIENALLTDAEIDWIDTEISTTDRNQYYEVETIIKNKLSKDKERSVEEVAGCREAMQIVLSDYNQFDPLKISDIKGLHRELLKYYPQANYYLGNYKTQTNSVVEKNSITGKIKRVLKTADPGIETETSMEQLIHWYNQNNKADIWTIPTAVEFVFRFLAVHPFQDGNGRLSRLLFQLILLNSADEYFAKLIPVIALDRELEKTRPRYYKVLRNCSQGMFQVDSTLYKYSQLLDYFIEMISASFHNIDVYSKKYNAYRKFSRNDLAVLGCFKNLPEQYLQTKDLIEILQSPRRTIIFSLNKLVEAGFIQKKGSGSSIRYKITF